MYYIYSYLFYILCSNTFSERPLSEESTLTFPYQSGYEDKNSLEPLSLTQSKLNLSLAECHLSVVWEDNLQTLWVYQTAVVSHETTGKIYHEHICNLTMITNLYISTHFNSFISVLLPLSLWEAV